MEERNTASGSSGYEPEENQQYIKSIIVRAREAAGPAAEKAIRAFNIRSRQAATAARTFATSRLKPWLAGAAIWTGRRLHPASLARDYRRILLLVHKFALDRSAERLFFVRTNAHIPLSVLHVPNPQRLTGHDYRPTPRLVFQWAMDALPEPVNRFAFVDYGAGRGRTLLLASHYPFEKIRGVEIARELHDDCLMNIAQYPRSLMKCRDVECMRAAAPSLPVPEQEAVFYFFNPFDRNVFERVLTGIARSYKREPRRFYLICVDMRQYQELIEDTGVFEAIQLRFPQRMKILSFSPYSVSVYRSVN